MSRSIEVRDAAGKLIGAGLLDDIGDRDVPYTYERTDQ
ncbi:MAG: hypothetical protein JWP74_1778 [Marmoricola sp.]|nr:hypothetical protein [Marmoricola sp.]